MSNSLLNESVKIKSQIDNNKNEIPELLNFMHKNQLNPKIKSLFKSMKNNFGIITCIGSENFYVFTRQMLLHLEYKTAQNLHLQNNYALQFQNFKTQTFLDQDYRKQSVYPKMRNKLSMGQVDKSFVIENNQNMKLTLHNQRYEVQSSYQQGHQILDKKIDDNASKKLQSNHVLQVLTPNPKRQSRLRKNYIQKNDQTLSQEDRSKSKHINKQFQKQDHIFKESIEKNKIEEFLNKQRFSKNQNQQQFNQQIKKNNFLSIYNNKQIGTDKERKPIQWIYCQTKKNNKQFIQFTYLLSSTVLVELQLKDCQNKKQFENQLKQYFQFYKSLEGQIDRFNQSNSGDMPNVVLICPIKQGFNIQNEKLIYQKIFTEVQNQYFPQNKRTSFTYQSPHGQYQNSHSPLISKLPPTPKRMPLSHRQSSFSIIHQNNNQSRNLNVSSVNQINKRIRLQFRILSQDAEKQGVLVQSYNRMRQVTSQGRRIFNQQITKSIGGNTVKSQCFFQLLQNIKQKLPNDVSVQDFYQQWVDLYSNYVQSNLDSAITLYEQKITQLLMGKSLVSKFKLQQAHDAAKKQCLRRFSQKKIGQSRVYIASSKNIINDSKQLNKSSRSSVRVSRVSRNVSIFKKLQQNKSLLEDDKNIGSNEQLNYQQSDLINLVQSRIDQLKLQFQLKTQSQSIKWLNSFLQAQTNLIFKKLQLNDIKSISSYKHELQFLREIFKKKLQSYKAQQYILLQEFQIFMFNSIFKGIQQLAEKQRQEWKQKIKQQTIKNEELFNQIKQIKKQYLNKQRNLIQNKSQLEKKIQQYQKSLDQLNRQLNEKQICILELKNQQQKKRQSNKNDHQAILASLTMDIQNLKNQFQTKKSEVLYLNSQLEKQQLLHKQTHQNYEHILVSYKNNVKQLQKKLKQAKNIQIQLNNQSMAQQSTQIIKNIQNQFNLRLSNLEQEINQKNKQNQLLMNQMKQQSQKFEEQIRKQKDVNKQIQLQRKLLQQKLIQIQSRLPRYKANQVILQKMQRQKQQFIHKINRLQNQKAIIEQKLCFNQQTSNDVKIKMDNLNKQLIQIKEQNQIERKKNQSLQTELYQQRNKQKSQVQCQTYLTVDILSKQLYKRCQNCKSNQIKLKQALQIVNSLNQSYIQLTKYYKKQNNCNLNSNSKRSNKLNLVQNTLQKHNQHLIGKQI